MGFEIPKGINKIPLNNRIDKKDYNIIDKLSKKNKKSYNFIINAMIKYSIENMDLKDIKKIKKIDEK